MREIFLATFLLACLSAQGDTLDVDFSGGIDSNFTAFQERDFWNVTTDATGLRIYKLADDGSTYSIEDPESEAGLLSTFTVDGDFSVTVDYQWNYVENPTFSGGNSALTLQVWSPSDPNARFWLNNFRHWTTSHGTNFKSASATCSEVAASGFAGPTPTQGKLRIERVGGLLLGYATDASGQVKLRATFSCGLIGGPMTVVVAARQVQDINSGNFSQIDPRGPMDGSFNNLSASADAIAYLSEIVAIDIKPGIDPQCRGALPIAILGSETLDVTQIDPGSLHFEDLGVRVKGNGGLACGYKDANGDGIVDMICQFQDEEREGTLAGKLGDGTRIVGTGTYCLAN